MHGPQSTEKLLQKRPEKMDPGTFISRLILAVRQDNDFSDGAKLYAHFMKGILQTPTPSNRYPDVDDPDKPVYQPKYQYLTDDRVRVFQKATATLVRYAPNPDIALRYAEFFLTQVYLPLRNERTELYILNNLIYMYTHAQERRIEYMRQALDWVKLGLERGMALRTDVPLREGFEGLSCSFARLSKPILIFHQIMPSADGRELVPGHR